MHPPTPKSLATPNADHSAAPAIASTGLLLRSSQEADLPQVLAIYADAVLHSTSSFETEAPTLAEMSRRWAEVASRGLPWLVLERHAEVLGYSFANWFKPRAGYRFCLENSIYIAPTHQRQGFGQMLLAELLARCETVDARQMLAVIAGADQHGSIALHRRLGFRDAGLLASVGWKSNRWIDVVLMQRQLGVGASTVPAEAAASDHAGPA